VLLEHGADVNARDENGATPLHHAAFDGNREIVSMLLWYLADKHVEDRYGQTPFE